MEINREEEISQRKKKYFFNDININSSEIAKERVNEYNKSRKSKINQELFNDKSNIKINSNFNNVAQENYYELSIQNLNIEPELKNENNIKAILNEDNLDKISEYITKYENNDYIKYGIYLLKEKFNSIKDISILDKYDFQELFFSLLNYSKNESTKLNFEPIMVKFIYDLIINYVDIANNMNTSFLCDEKYFDLHLYFIDNISDMNIVKIILGCIEKILVNNDGKLICEIFEYNNEIFFNKLIEILNDFQKNNEIIPIILELFINYINIFNRFEKLNSKKSTEIEMKDNTHYYNNNIIETIYNHSLSLISTKHFDNSLYIISNIIKIVHKSKNFAILEKIITNPNNILMLNFILEKDYSNCAENLGYLSDVIKYIIKLGITDKNANIKELVNSVDKNLSEYDNILNIFIDFLLNHELKLKDKICVKLIEVILEIIKNEIYINEISDDDKYNIYEIILEYIQSSNYKIRKKIMKILKIITNNRDYIQADFFIKNKILYYIKQAIDPSITYCTDEKLILLALNILNNFLSLGDSIKVLNGVNTVLYEFENIGGKEMLDNLLCNKSENVFNYTSNLIDKYFN